MTREEAIITLTNTASLLRDGTRYMKLEHEKQFREALDMAIKALEQEQQDLFVDEDKLKRCRFEYINACKIVAYPTPDTSKNDIYDAYAVMKALYPIFGDEELR